MRFFHIQKKHRQLSYFEREIQLLYPFLKQVILFMLWKPFQVKGLFLVARQEPFAKLYRLSKMLYPIALLLNQIFMLKSDYRQEISALLVLIHVQL